MDSANKIISAMQYAAEHCGIPRPAPDDVKNIIGISLVPAIQILFTLSDTLSGRRKAEDIAEAYKRAYHTLDKEPCELFEGIPDLLSLLHGRGTLLAVATGKARNGLSRAWAQSDTANYFAVSRCADEARSKPDPDMLQQILSETGVEVADAVMIGDTSHDMAMAEAIGMSRIAVSYGVHTVSQLQKHQPCEIAHSGSELLSLFI